MDQRRLAVMLMLGQAMFFAAETAVIHHLGPAVWLVQLGVVRGAGGLLLIAVLARGALRQVFATKQLPKQIFRALLTVGHFWVLIWSLRIMPFADATAILFTTVAYIAAFSGPILGEHVTPTRWFAALLAIAGALLIANPAFGVPNIGYLLVLLGTSLNGLAFVMNRYLTRPGGDSALTTMLYVNLMLIAINLPVVAAAPLPVMTAGPWLVGVMILGPVGLYLGIVAVAHAEASSLGPYTLAQLPVAVLAGLLLFGEMPGAMAWIGIVAITVACLLPFMPERKLLLAGAQGED